MSEYKFRTYPKQDDDDKRYETNMCKKSEMRFYDLLSPSEQVRYVLSDIEKQSIQNGKNSLKVDNVEMTLALFEKEDEEFVPKPPTDPKAPDKLPDASISPEK
ncbi:hypothetical protein KAZ93_00205 [Patescibacteria group bacterium]|nr:hypothetical protein [Patescibacteria group bacterium]